MIPWTKLRNCIISGKKTRNKQEYIDFFGGRASTPVTVISQFKGLQIQDLPEFEQCFEVNVHMYSLEEDGVVVSVFQSTERYSDTMYVDQFENHCSYVMDFAQFAKTFKCQLCDRMFDHHGHYKQHSKICNKKPCSISRAGSTKSNRPCSNAWTSSASTCHNTIGHIPGLPRSTLNPCWSSYRTTLRINWSGPKSTFPSASASAQTFPDTPNPLVSSNPT